MPLGLVVGEWREAPGTKDFPVNEPSSDTMLCHCAGLGRQGFLDAIEVLL